MELFFGWLVLSGVVAYLASSRGRLAFDYLLLSLFLSPLVGLIVVLAKPNLAEDARTGRIRREEQDRQIAALKSTQNSDSHEAGLGKSDSAKFVADEIAKLGELRDRGLISDSEFQARKNLLLE